MTPTVRVAMIRAASSPNLVSPGPQGVRYRAAIAAQFAAAL
jgi:hypothetical protein